MSDPCGHDHSGDSTEQRLACHTAHFLRQRTGDAVAVVMLPDDDNAAPAVSAVANAASFAGLASALLQLAVHQPRPTDCAVCQAAHDSMTQALAVLGRPTGRCQ